VLRQRGTKGNGFQEGGRTRQERGATCWWPRKTREVGGTLLSRRGANSKGGGGGGTQRLRRAKTWWQRESRRGGTQVEKGQRHVLAEQAVGGFGMGTPGHSAQHGAKMVTGKLRGGVQKKTAAKVGGGKICGIGSGTKEKWWTCGGHTSRGCEWDTTGANRDTGRWATSTRSKHVDGIDEIRRQMGGN